MNENLETNNVTFETDQLQVNNSAQNKTKAIIYWIIDHSGGHIETEEHASYLILGLVGVTLLASLLLFLNIGTTPPPKPSDEELLKMSTFKN